MRRSSGIREWETIEEVASHGEDVTVDGRTMRIGAKLETKRPVFNDGNKGRPVLEMTVFKDNWSFRFRVPREGGDEATTAVNALQLMLAEIPAGREKLEKAWADYEKARDEEKAKGIREHEKRMDEEKKRGGHSSRSAGGGLGKFSKPGKTARKRRSRREKPAE